MVAKTRCGEPVEWVSYRRKTYWIFVNYCKSFDRNNLGKDAKKKPINLLKFKDHPGFSKIVFMETTYFEDNYFFFLRANMSDDEIL